MDKASGKGKGPTDAGPIARDGRSIARDEETEAMVICQSPLCEVQFEMSGLAMKPRRYCSNACKDQASVIRQAARLLEGLSDDEVIAILKTTGKEP